MLTSMTKHEIDPFRGGPTMTVRETARLLRLPTHVVAAAVMTGRLPRRRRGLRLVVPRQELMTSFGAPLTERQDRGRDR